MKWHPLRVASLAILATVSFPFLVRSSSLTTTQILATLAPLLVSVGVAYAVNRSRPSKAITIACLATFLIAIGIYVWMLVPPSTYVTAGLGSVAVILFAFPQVVE